MTVFAFIQPDTARNVLLGVGYLGYHALRRRSKRPKTEEKKVKGEEKVKVEGQGQDEVENVGGGGDRNLTSESVDQHGRARTPSAPGESALPQLNKTAEPPSLTLPSDLNPSPTDDAIGKALYKQARALPHRMIPDFRTDGPYLDLLGKSAATGYAPALAKLGEYAMRRAAWVEAYYWMPMAKRQGMQGLSVVMREIRKNWSLDGFPNEAENVNRLYTLEAGSIGRALIHVDSGHKAAKAREFLKANHPEFLKCHSLPAGR